MELQRKNAIVVLRTLMDMVSFTLTIPALSHVLMVFILIILIDHARNVQRIVPHVLHQHSAPLALMAPIS